MIDLFERTLSQPSSYLTALGLSAMLTLGFLQTDPAQAQESVDSLGAVLEEIVVTARKRDELLKDVPVAISVVTADFVREAGIRDQFDLFELTPGLNYGEV